MNFLLRSVPDWMDIVGVEEAMMVSFHVASVNAVLPPVILKTSAYDVCGALTLAILFRYPNSLSIWTVFEERLAERYYQLIRERRASLVTRRTGGARMVGARRWYQTKQEGAHVFVYLVGFDSYLVRWVQGWIVQYWCGDCCSCDSV